MIETWLPIPGFEGRYEASTQGRVRSLCRRNVRVLKPVLGDRGYLRFRWGKVHILVCTTFHGPRPPGMEVRHRDGDKLNNRPDNLCWGTRAENMADLVAHGQSTRGTKSWTAKLTEDDVRRIRSMGGSTREVGPIFGISHHQVSMIRRRANWAHVD